MHWCVDKRENTQCICSVQNMKSEFPASVSPKESENSSLATVASLERDLVLLGLKSGDTVFVHSSFKSLGPVDDGAGTVVRALELAIAPDGLLLMPSFNLVEKVRRPATWNVATTPASTGWISEYFRTLPGTVRSDHYSHSVAARGVRAAEWVCDSAPDTGMKSPWDLAPWMLTFGRRSPLFRCYERGAKVLMLGVGYDHATFIHLLEVMDWNRRLQTDEGAEFLWIDRVAAGVAWEKFGLFASGRVGRAFCRLFDLSVFIDTMLFHLKSDRSLFKTWPKHSDA